MNTLNTFPIILIMLTVLGCAKDNQKEQMDVAKKPAREKSIDSSEDTKEVSDTPINDAAVVDKDDLALPSVRIKLFGNPQCGYCKKAIKLLNEKNIPFDFYNLKKEKSLLKKLRNEVGRATFPYVFIDGEYIGGLVQLQGYISQNLNDLVE